VLFAPIPGLFALSCVLEAVLCANVDGLELLLIPCCFEQLILIVPLILDETRLASSVLASALAGVLATGTREDALTFAFAYVL